MAQPNKRLAGPLDQWEVGAKLPIDASGFCKALCQHCFTCHNMIGSATHTILQVARDLRQGESLLDRVWLAQCGIEVVEKRYVSLGIEFEL